MIGSTFTEKELEFLRGFFGRGTFAEDPDDDIIFQSIQEKLGNKPTQYESGLFLWTVLLRADRVDTLAEMSRILGAAIAENCGDIIEIMEIYPGDVTDEVATDYELEKREESK